MINMIKIVKTPTGEAPEWVREAWVGLFLPLYYIANESGEVEGVVSRQIIQIAREKVWCVEQNVAIGLLMTQNEKAAEWWIEQGYPIPDKVFTFGHDEAELVSGAPPDLSNRWYM